MFDRNVGGDDRRLRAVLAVVFAVVAAWGPLEGRRPLAVVAGLAALGTGSDAVGCWCGVNEALGLDTTRRFGPQPTPPRRSSGHTGGRRGAGGGPRPSHTERDAAPGV